MGCMEIYNLKYWIADKRERAGIMESKGHRNNNMDYSSLAYINSQNGKEDIYLLFQPAG